MSSTRIGIGLLGFGTVGSGLYAHLQEKGDAIEAKCGVRFDVRKILVRDPLKKRSIAIPSDRLAASFEDIIADKTIDVVVEVIGGNTLARQYILEALKNGKDVITANKSLVAAEGELLVGKARQSGRYFGFSAAVTGCHQLCTFIAESTLIKSLAGIFNGTSNFILEQMEGGLSFEAAIKSAQQHGYAEADPANDVDGIDTRNKLMILSRLAYGVELEADKIEVSGIRDISQVDIQHAKKLGYAIKLLGIAKPTEAGFVARVHPSFIPMRHQLANVKGIGNGVQVYDHLRGAQIFIAAGAGAGPTAAALLVDLITVGTKEDPQIAWTAPSRADLSVKYAKPSSNVRRYYVRIDADNKPGVLAKISKVFARHDINIGEVIQHGQPDSKSVPVIIMCGPTDEATIKKALKEIAELTETSSKAHLIRVEDSLENLGAENEAEESSASLVVG